MFVKVVVLIDGGHTRVLARKAGYIYNPDYIEKIALSCIIEEESVLRILYYDCAPYSGSAKLPVSGIEKTFDGSDLWLRKLAEKDLFAIRLGVLKFRGFKPKKIPVAKSPLTDEDFKPDFEQKGVDMRIGLDIASYAAKRVVSRIILISGDTDCVPAMKLARIEGLQVAIVTFPNQRLASELRCHADFERHVKWPSQ